MEKLIALYIKSLEPVSVLSFKTNYGRILHTVAEFKGKDGKFYSLSVAHTNYSIIGDPNTMNKPKESVAFLEDRSETDGPLGLFSQIARYLIKHETFEEFKKYSSMNLLSSDSQGMYKMYSEFLEKNMKTVYNTPFTTMYVNIDDWFVYVYFQVFNRIEEPIRLLVGDKTAIKLRKYGKHTDSYKKYLELLGEHTGGVILYE